MKANFIFSILVVSLLEIQAQAPTIEWQKCLGGSDFDLIGSVIQTNDSGYIIGGSTYSMDGDVVSNNGLSDFWIAKLNDLGNLEWTNNFGGSAADDIHTVLQSIDGGYVLAGSTYSMDGDVSGNNGLTDYWIVKLDTLGNIEWQRNLGGTSFDEAYSLISTTDGGYILAGTTSSNDLDVSGHNGFTDYWVVKLDGLGNIAWQKCIGGSGEENARCVIQCADKGYVVAGYSTSMDLDSLNNKGDDDYYVVKLDSNGNSLWHKNFGGSASDEAHSVIQTIDGGYLVAGFSQSNDSDVVSNNGLIDYWIIKLDSLGNLTWQTSIGGTDYDYAYSVISLNDSNFLIAGGSLSNNGDVSGNHGDSDAWLVKLSSTGNIIWQKSIGGDFYDVATSIIQTTDGSYLVAGETVSNNEDVSGNHGEYDLWLIKLSSDSNISTNEKQNTLGITSLTLYPNPASETLNLELEGPSRTSGASVPYQIVDLQGKVVLNGVLNQGKNLLSIAGLAKGSYVIRTESTGMVTESGVPELSRRGRSMPFEVVR